METSAKTAMNVNDIFLAIGKFWNFLFSFLVFVLYSDITRYAVHCMQFSMSSLLMLSIQMEAILIFPFSLKFITGSLYCWTFHVKVSPPRMHILFKPGQIPFLLFEKSSCCRFGVAWLKRE